MAIKINNIAASRISILKGSTTITPPPATSDLPVAFELFVTKDDPNLYGTSGQDNFGTSVATSNSFSIVGASGERDASGLQTGAAYIFSTTDGSLLFTLADPNRYGTTPYDAFGVSVGISESFAIVGATGEDDANGFNSGKAYIFSTTDGSLLFTLDNPNAYDTGLNDNFGYSVSISETHAIVGTNSEDTATGINSGKAYIFSTTDGSLLFTLDNPNADGSESNDYFGKSVSISQSYAIVGSNDQSAADELNSGKAYIFSTTDGSLLFTLDNPNAYDTAGADYFGSSVAISETHAIVGATGEDDAGGTASGKAYIFSTTDGSLLFTLDNPRAINASANDSFFGYSVSISGSVAIVGAYGEGTLQSGAAYIFSTTDGSLLFTLVNPNAYGTSDYDSFGKSVAIVGTHAIVGAVYEDEANQTNSGKVYMYNLLY
jgi:hypothetical protein